LFRRQHRLQITETKICGKKNKQAQVPHKQISTLVSFYAFTGWQH